MSHTTGLLVDHVAAWPTMKSKPVNPTASPAIVPCGNGNCSKFDLPVMFNHTAGEPVMPSSRKPTPVFWWMPSTAAPKPFGPVPRFTPTLALSARTQIAADALLLLAALEPPMMPSLLIV